MIKMFVWAFTSWIIWNKLFLNTDLLYGIYFRRSVVFNFWIDFYWSCLENLRKITNAWAAYGSYASFTIIKILMN